jgi:hypothetical protein
VVAGEERTPGPGVGGEDEGHGGIDARLAHAGEGRRGGVGMREFRDAGLDEKLRWPRVG